MPKGQTERNVVLLAMLIASMLSAIFYARYQLVNSIGAAKELFEIVFGS